MVGMGYLHIENLYKAQHVLLFRECYALEKIHGTSAHVAWREGRCQFFSGGESHDRFVALFDESALTATFQAMGHPEVTLYGEAYGGRQQGQSWRYGKVLKFVVFDVQVSECWLSVPQAAEVVAGFGLEFVHFAKVPTELAAIDAERDAPSEQARRNGVDGCHPREGVVLCPPIEVTTNNGNRIIAKHKRDEERETKEPRRVMDVARLEVLTSAQAIAEEWVTPVRLAHVLDKLPRSIGVEQTRDVIAAMTEDVLREGVGEIVDGREVRQAIGRRTAETFKQWLKTSLEVAS